MKINLAFAKWIKKWIIPISMVAGVAVLTTAIVLIVVLTGRCKHEKVIDPAREVTCAQTGLTEGSHCSKCGKVFVAQKETPKFNHKYNDYVFENNDSKVYTVSELKEIFGEELNDFEWAGNSGATCITPGYGILKCTGCNNSILINTLKDHNWVVKDSTASSCISKGYSNYTCTTEGCAETKIEYFGELAEHTWVVDKENSPIVEVTPGVYEGTLVYICEIDGCTATKSIEAKSIKEFRVEATCKEDGKHWYECEYIDPETGSIIKETAIVEIIEHPNNMHEYNGIEIDTYATWSISELQEVFGSNFEEDVTLASGTALFSCTSCEGLVIIADLQCEHMWVGRTCYICNKER